MIFSDFSRYFKILFLRIGLDWRALVESRSPNIEKQRGFFFATKKLEIKKKLKK